MPTHPVTTAQQDTPFEEAWISCTYGLQQTQTNKNFLDFLHQGQGTCLWTLVCVAAPN